MMADRRALSQVYLRQTLPFDSALSDQTGGQPKVFRRDYLGEGMLPVVDQGAAQIAGYTDDEDAAYRGSLPVILFGDHTRVFKYVDFPFALGADGVKALQPAPWYEPKFLYYYLLTSDIPGRGYSRHFKYLKEIGFPFLPRSEQRRIVEILDQADRLRRLRAEADAKADRILPALFIKMFGDPATNPMGWPMVPFEEALCDVTAGQAKTQKKDSKSAGSYPIVDQGQDEIAGYTDEHAALFRGQLPVIVFGDHTRTFKYVDHPFALGAEGVRVLSCRHGFRPLFVVELLRFLPIPSAGYSRHYKFLREFSLIAPPLQLQEHFTLAGSGVQHSRVGATASARRLDALFATLLPRAFAGDLTASWREAHMKELLQEMKHQAEALAKVEPC